MIGRPFGELGVTSRILQVSTGRSESIPVGTNVSTKRGGRVVVDVDVEVDVLTVGNVGGGTSVDVGATSFCAPEHDESATNNPLISVTLRCFTGRT
jgi:hypothetical protein